MHAFADYGLLVAPNKAGDKTQHQSAIVLREEFLDQAYHVLLIPSENDFSNSPFIFSAS